MPLPSWITDTIRALQGLGNNAEPMMTRESRSVPTMHEMRRETRALPNALLNSVMPGGAYSDVYHPDLPRGQSVVQGVGYAPLLHGFTEGVGYAPAMGHTMTRETRSVPTDALLLEELWNLLLAARR
jgi:hypothetical protein